MRFFLKTTLIAGVFIASAYSPLPASPIADSLKPILITEDNPEVRLQPFLLLCEIARGPDTAQMNRYCKQPEIPHSYPQSFDLVRQWFDEKLTNQGSPTIAQLIASTLSDWQSKFL